MPLLVHETSNGDRLQCPGQSCPTCRLARGEDLTKPNVQFIDGAWQILFWPKESDRRLKMSKQDLLVAVRAAQESVKDNISLYFLLQYAIDYIEEH